MCVCRHIHSVFSITSLYACIWSPINYRCSALCIKKVVNISNNTGNSYLPQVAITSENENQAYNDNIYIVRTDNTTGNGDIYFTQAN